MIDQMNNMCCHFENNYTDFNNKNKNYTDFAFRVNWSTNQSTGMINYWHVLKGMLGRYSMEFTNILHPTALGIENRYSLA